MADFEDRARGVEKDLKSALEESRTSERRLDDNRRNLEIQLDNANEEIQVCSLLMRNNAVRLKCHSSV